MNDDSDLKRMFDAQRKVDEGAAPSFDHMYSGAVGSRAASPHSLRPKIAVMCAVAVLVLLVVYLRESGPARKNAPPAVENDLIRLDQRCDSLLAAIQQTEFEPTRSTDQDLNPQMVWPTVTASLIPFDTLTLNTRSHR